MSFRFIEDHRDAYPVRLMCAVLEVSPAGYYAWRERPQSTRTVTNAALLADNRQVHQDSLSLSPRSANTRLMPVDCPSALPPAYRRGS